MKLIAQQDKLPILNNDVDSSIPQRTKHSPLLPNSIRALLCGPSASGKTNMMMCLLTSPHGLKFENLYVFSKSLYQPKYIQLEEIMNSIPEITYETFNNTSAVLPPEEAKENSVFIFDDVICDKQDNMRNYFSMGRHRAVDSFYLCQTYAKVPKHLIRDNANLICLFKQDDLNLRHVYQDHVSPDVTFEQFKKICQLCWTEPHSFITIDKECDITNGRYRKGFDKFVRL
jgi:hypothetical protein